MCILTKFKLVVHCMWHSAEHFAPWCFIFEGKQEGLGMRLAIQGKHTGVCVNNYNVQTNNNIILYWHMGGSHQCYNIILYIAS